jgi:hypothetical protein
MEDAMPIEQNHLNHERHNLLFGVQRSVRYHNRRRLFFDRLNKISTFLSALFGTATVASALSSFNGAWTIVFAVLVAIFSVIDLVVGTAQAARMHYDLARKFIDLEKDIVSKKKPAEEEMIKFQSRRLEIEADEPPPLKMLDMICHNELLRAKGYCSSEFVKIKWYQRLFAQFIDVGEHRICPPALENKT